LPEESRTTNHQLQIDGGDRQWPVDRTVHAYDIEVPTPSLQDHRSDLMRVSETLNHIRPDAHLFADPPAVAQLTRRLREQQWRIGVHVRNDELIGVTAAGEQSLGFAVDVGTTKIAGYLLDLATGRELAADGLLNPQTRYGDDIMSRLQYASQNPDSNELALLLCDALNGLLQTLVEKAQSKHEQVVDACFVGNTAITHLLLGLPVRQLAVAPYVAATSAAMDIRASALGLNMAPGAYAHILPSIGGFVGADHVAMIVGTDIDRQDQISLGVDIGTNTEIALRDPRVSYLSCLSCPSGPAFEGAHVTSGMRASDGAIEAVHMTENRVHLRTIGNQSPIGLCGSGIIDVMAELYRMGIINERGRFQSADPRVRKGPRGNEFLLSPADRNGVEGDIVITQKDVDEIQLAKGAIQAGINVLLEETGVAPESVSQVFVAGAFGSYLSMTSAMAIGLLPFFPNARYLQVGNTAAIGAIQTLISGEARQRADQIARQARYIELTTHPRFTRCFAEGMLFPKDLSMNIGSTECVAN
jgi:uncharacterized 2Fe-2S/4Fe-4S cluster protein (DUF4445 family)